MARERRLHPMYRLVLDIALEYTDDVQGLSVDPETNFYYIYPSESLSCLQNDFRVSSVLHRSVKQGSVILNKLSWDRYPAFLVETELGRISVEVRI